MAFFERPEEVRLSVNSHVTELPWKWVIQVEPHLQITVVQANYLSVMTDPDPETPS